MKQENIQSQHTVQQMVQQQSLTALQVTAVRLTEMSLEALEHRVENECLENPWLEKDTSQMEAEGQELSEGNSDDDRLNDYRSDDDVPDYLLRTRNSENTPENMEYGDTLSFFDQLKAQMAEFDITPHQEQVLEYLIGTLDDDGLLKKNLSVIADEMDIYQGIETTAEEVEQMLKILWQFDPPGVGARSLQECLLLQIRRDARNPLKKELETLMENSFDDFMHKRWDKIQRRMKLTDGQVKNLQREILRLNPRPGMAMGEKVGNANHQITPDFMVETDIYGNIQLTLNQGNVPTLTISEDALEMLKKAEGLKQGQMTRSAIEELQYTKSYVERGQMFINALAMRRESMTRTMKAIIHLQKDFFLEGDEALLKPMILEDVSNLSGVSISVVSRVCNSKYVETPFGTYPLRWFFSLKAATQTGDDDVSVRKIKALLRQLVEGEDKQKPLNDEKLTQLIAEQGFQIARRTVAKYREQMGIPVARLRK